MLCSAEPEISNVVFHLLEYPVTLKDELLCLTADVVISLMRFSTPWILPFQLLQGLFLKKNLELTGAVIKIIFHNSFNAIISFTSMSLNVNINFLHISV